jgi:hypothetical protein
MAPMLFTLRVVLQGWRLTVYLASPEESFSSKVTDLHGGIVLGSQLKFVALLVPSNCAKG